MPKTQPQPEKDNKNEFAELLASLQNKFGEGSVMTLGDTRKMDVKVVSTGSFSLDRALGVDGLPKGRVVEIFGPESSGKTTLALNVVAQAQKGGGKCAFIDAEHALDPDYAAKIGVKIKELIISQPDNGEEALNILEALVRSTIIDVAVVDSVAALTPKAEIDGQMGQQFMGLQARMMAQALRKLTAIASKSGTLIIFINQIRMQIGVMFGCLNYKSKITLANGKTEWIGKIVNQKIPAKILSYDWKKNRVMPSQVTGWYKNGNAEKFLQIAAYNPSGNGKAQISCTTNHPILTPTGWRRAENIAVGDLILINSIQRLSNFQWEIIRGSLLGDGNLSPTRVRASLGTRFRLGHGLKQKKYLLWKTSFFSNIHGSLYENKKAIKFDLTPLPELYTMHKTMYKETYKYLTSEFLANLTPLSLAIWYQDDGNLAIRNKAKTKGRITFCIQTIHPQSRESFKNLLEEKYDIKTTLAIVAKQAILRFDQNNTEKFLLLVQQYIHPSMNYKLLPHNKYALAIKPEFIDPIKKLLAVPIISITPKPESKSMVRFDIRVKGFHNFLADNIVVHNSPETTPGGRALKFASSVRLDVRRIAQVKKGEEVVGSRVKVKVVKNKVAAPFKVAEFDIMYGTGISYEGDVLNVAIAKGIVAKSGSTYSFDGVKLGVGFENARLTLKADKKITRELEKRIIAAE